MKTWTMIFAAAMLAGSAHAAEAPAVESVISATGEGNWEIICHVVRPGGEQIVRILNAQQNKYSDASLLRASCDVRNANRAPLAVSISAPAMRCPFKVEGANACEQTFAKGRAGSFEFSTKATR